MDTLHPQSQVSSFPDFYSIDDAVRELMRRKLFKFLNPGAEYPKGEVSESEVEDGDVEVHQRLNFGAGDTATATTSHSNVRTKTIGEQQHRSKFPVIVVVGFVILNVLLAATIFYRNLLF
ncbi:hypothetical protein TcWFU_003479 [Taenia crassiceps]|uniref:Uncharacterized protein n=1 Tax=Taenia crassiceps TaxID=6207 RepID=A0ABR4Q1G6_9CEST